MKYGTFIGIDHAKRVVKGANREPMFMEEYMQHARIRDPRDVIGPFETILADKAAKRGQRIANNEVSHMMALREARQEQVRLAQKLKNS